MKYTRCITKMIPNPQPKQEVWMLISRGDIEHASVFVLTNSESYARVMRREFRGARLVSGVFKQDESPLKPERLRVHD